MQEFFKRLGHCIAPSAHNAYRPYLLTRPWLVFFLSVILTAEGVFVAGLLVENSANNFLAAVLPAEVVTLTNTERTNVGLTVVHENPLLALAAQRKAEDMALRGYFSHVGPDGKEPWAWISEAGYSYRTAGENLAVRFSESSDVVRAWMASPTHRANIVKPNYEEIGIGVADGMYEGKPATFVVQYFGTPQIVAAASSQASPIQAPAPEPSVVEVSTTVAGAQTETGDAPPVITHAPQTPPSVMRVAAEAVPYSNTTAMWILGIVASLLVLVLALTFFMHISIQPTDMLVGGSFVTAAALLFAFANTTTTFDMPGSFQNQAASVFVAKIQDERVLVGESAVSIDTTQNMSGDNNLAQ